MGSKTLRAITANWLALLALLCLVHQPVSGQSLIQATTSEANQDYVTAVQRYRLWLATDQASGADKRHAKIKLPVLEEASLMGGGLDVDLYLDALTARSEKNTSLALSKLTQLIENHPASRLRDDSLYLQGYILLMDNFDYSGSANAMASLRAELPDSLYYDTALYSQAIAEEQQGNITAATTLLSELRDRHTGFSIGLIDFSLPKDQLTSRYWFKRSDQRLDIIKLANEHAARVISRSTINHPDYQWRMIITSEGKNYTLLLKPSAILKDTQLSATTDNSATDSGIDNSVEVLAGIVEGEPDSWARITIEGNTLTGTLSVAGTRQPLLAAATDGSLGYYNRLLRSDINGNTANQHAAALRPPKDSNAIDNFLDKIKSHNNKTKKQNQITHIARLGVVIDSQYNDYHSGNGFSRALSILNHTDGIFREEFGVALHIESVVVLTDREQDPMNIGYQTMEQMLKNFRRYRMKTKKLGKDIGLATLFTGNKNSDLPMGLAWIDAACRRDGFDVSVVTPFRNTELLSTHEIAHSLGAPHDADTSCGEGRHLMSRRLSSKTKQSFSSCSIQSVKARLASNSCHTKATSYGFE